MLHSVKKESSGDTGFSALLEKYAKENPGYWDFRGRSNRTYCHGWMSYPAMMVPEMQGTLIDCLLQFDPSIGRIMDPFVGSGTVLGESILRGKPFFGADINPLAVLCCKAKIDFFDKSEAEAAIDRVVNRVSSARFEYSVDDFAGAAKWFTPPALTTLSKLKDAIRAESENWIRRFLWVVLSDVVRLASNTRSSTYKLHIRAVENSLSAQQIVEIFTKKCRENSDRKGSLWWRLAEDHLVRNGVLVNEYAIELKDARSLDKADGTGLVITSPPYGDNKTTVTYGQYSFLPLQFIDPDDIDATAAWQLRRLQSSIDSASLGGCLSDVFYKRDHVAPRSLAFRRTLSAINARSGSGEKRFVSFFYDLNESLGRIVRSVDCGGFLMLTLGNREIAGVRVPLDQITSELLSYYGAEEVSSLGRSIPNKRMPGSMSNETILIMRKA